MRFTREKSSIDRLEIALFGSYYISEVGLLLVDLCMDLGILVDTELKFYAHIETFPIIYIHRWEKFCNVGKLAKLDALPF